VNGGPVAAVAARALRKTYGPIEAVAGVDVTVETGDVYGYLGPNGAGKTTSLRMMLGLIQPTSGEVRLFGRDPVLDPVGALQGVAGFVEDPAFYPYLSGRANLELLAALDGDSAERIDGVLELVELSGRAGDRVRGYSHGMRQRLGLAAALLRRPRLLVLDEPTTGLDPAGMRDMRALVRQLAAEGITVLLSSHLMGEVEALCNRVAILRAGRVRYEGTLAELLGRSDGRYRLEATDPGRAFGLASAAEGIRDLRADGAALEFAADGDAVSALTTAIGSAGIGILALVPATGLEDMFLDLTERDGA
jgi:ABC-2 type transport system ATP-binding protein